MENTKKNVSYVQIMEETFGIYLVKVSREEKREKGINNIMRNILKLVSQ